MVMAVTRDNWLCESERAPHWADCALMMGMLPIIMQLVQACDALRLSGLTPHQLREWCGRRALVAPDVPPVGRGRHALYSWQTILVLRLLSELHSKFGIELAAWGDAIAQCQALLRKRAFPSLWGLLAAFPDARTAELVEHGSLVAGKALLCLPLEPHLEAIAADFSQTAPKQLPLFAAIAVQR